MHYAVLAADYDGTIAHDGAVSLETLEALERLKSSGRKLVLVTGRELDDLIVALPEIGIFDRVVAENGALLYQPETREERKLAQAPPPIFAERLRARNVDPLSVGRVIVATWHPNEGTVLETIRELSLDLQIIFNKGAVMVLPAGVNKESGLRAALDELGVSQLACVGVGDAENDSAFLALSGTSVAVANALQTVKERATITLERERGAGVVELVDRILADDLASVDASNPKQLVELADGLLTMPHRERVLLAGSSGGGKSTLTQGWVERLNAAGFQVCLIDPEGDYEDLEGVVSIGTAREAPQPETVAATLRKGSTSVSINLLGIKAHDRPAYFAQLMPELVSLRAKVGRPQVILVDEAHHVLPSNGECGDCPKVERGMMFVTVAPESLAASVLEATDRLIAVSETSPTIIETFCKARSLHVPRNMKQIEKGLMVSLTITEPEPAIFTILPSSGAKRRHLRKYAEGCLGEDKSFYFKGDDGKLNLRARNVIAFLELADGIDDETWLFHRKRGDYSEWIASAIKDTELATEVAEVEKSDLNSERAKEAIRILVEKRYTLPA